AKKKRVHYLVKDRCTGFKCLNCGDGGSIEHLKSYRCDALEAESDATYIASRKLAETLRAEEEATAGSGDSDVEAELLREQLALEELLLQAEEGELQRLLAEDEAALLEAKILSLEPEAKAPNSLKRERDLADLTAEEEADLREAKNSPKQERDIADLIREEEAELAEVKARNMRARAQAQATPQHHKKILKIPHITTKRTLEDPNAKAMTKKPRVEVQSQSQRIADANKHVENVIVCPDNLETQPLEFHMGGLDVAADAKLDDDAQDGHLGTESVAEVSVAAEGSEHESEEGRESHHTLHYEESAKEVLPECPDAEPFKALSPAEQVQQSGGKLKKKKNKKAAGLQDEEIDEEGSAPRRGGRGGRGGRGATARGRGRGRGRKQNEEPVEPKEASPVATEPEESEAESAEVEDVEPEEQHSKRKRDDAGKPTATTQAKTKAAANATAKTAAKAKAKTAAKAKAKTAPEAKAKPAAKAKAKTKATGPAANPKAAAAKDGGTKAKTSGKGLDAEQKALKSRKSVAYHKAMTQARNEGKALDVCKKEAQAVSRFILAWQLQCGIDVHVLCYL
ncbi:unnamed protein product, partial [Symbiodinium sp. CCMP2456]